MAAVVIGEVGGFKISRDDATRILVASKSAGMIFSVSILGCCGIKEICNLKAATEVIGIKGLVHQLAEMMYAKNRVYNCAFYLFSEVQPSSYYAGGVYGVGLRDFILENGLGTITESPILVNPNSNNKLKAYIWGVDHEALKKFHGVTVDPVEVCATPPQAPQAAAA